MGFLNIFLSFFISSKVHSPAVSNHIFSMTSRCFHFPFQVGLCPICFTLKMRNIFRTLRNFVTRDEVWPTLEADREILLPTGRRFNGQLGYEFLIWVQKPVQKFRFLTFVCVYLDGCPPKIGYFIIV
jgi:hypothetical protein